jgi:hypothetical protein
MKELIEVNSFQASLARDRVGKGGLAAVGRSQDTDAVAEIREIHRLVFQARSSARQSAER